MRYLPIPFPLLLFLFPVQQIIYIVDQHNNSSIRGIEAMKKSYQIGICKLLTIGVLVLLLGTTTTAVFSAEYEVFIETDQSHYYPGETVYVTGQLRRDSMGVPGGYCPKALDPLGEDYWDPQSCYGSEPDGIFNFEFDITPGSMLGTYTACAHGYIDTWEGWGNVTFEVVSEEVIVEAYGPYEGDAGTPIQFTGDASGGKPDYEWSWDFGDGVGTSDEQNPEYTYEDGGEYIVTLTVTDGGGTQGFDTADVTIIGMENNPPSIPVIEGPLEGQIGEEYDYTFVSNDPEGEDVYYWVEWFEGCPGINWQGPYPSGEEVTFSNVWPDQGTYTIQCKAKDIHDAESDWGDLTVTMPQSDDITQEHSFFFGLFPHESNGQLSYWSFGWKTVSSDQLIGFRGKFIIFGFVQ